jgi:CRP-like cAMP-binding protein
MFGAYELISGTKRAVRASAKTDTTLYIINKDQFGDLFHTNDITKIRDIYDPSIDQF